MGTQDQGFSAIDNGLLSSQYSLPLSVDNFCNFVILVA